VDPLQLFCEESIDSCQYGWASARIMALPHVLLFGGGLDVVPIHGRSFSVNSNVDAQESSVQFKEGTMLISSALLFRQHSQGA
jgi:hypothetical protein